MSILGNDFSIRKIEEIIDTPCHKNELSSDPEIYTIDNMLTKEECEHFINISKDNLKRALVSGKTEGYVSRGRSGSNTWLDHNHDEITLRVGQKIAGIVGIPFENAERFQVIHYDENQEYRNHFDSWDHDGSEKTLRNMKYGGARMRTALVYLNTVEEGGGTRMSKLDITVEAKEGRLLVFDNVCKGTNIKHPLSEHAGTPVIRGEKYAFNLWFRECNRSLLYSSFNPDYYTKEQLGEVENRTGCDIKKEDSFINVGDLIPLVSECIFNEAKYPSCWINLSKIPNLVKKLVEYTGENINKFENANVILYKNGAEHGPFHDAYDTTTERGRKYTKSRGQRMKTLTFVMGNSINISFPKLERDIELSSGDLLYYTNTDITTNSNNRNCAVQHVVKNNTSENTMVVNIYIREYGIVKPSNEVKLKPQEDYMRSLRNVYDRFSDQEIRSFTQGSFSYRLSNKLINKDIAPVVSYMATQSGIVNSELLERDDYVFDEETPIKLENTIDSEALRLCQEYYRRNIKEDKFTLGDRQSKRYKHYDEPVSRFLQYECLPLIEKIVKKKLRPTYTYLSSYVKGSDLPAHTDREDCQYTVSFLIDKPEGVSWPIYFHKKTQPIKYKGRYGFTPDIEECEAIDCEAGGLMMFCGQNHIHFREKTEADFYTIVLLHYRELG